MQHELRIRSIRFLIEFSAVSSLPHQVFEVLQFFLDLRLCFGISIACRETSAWVDVEGGQLHVRAPPPRGLLPLFLFLTQSHLHDHTAALSCKWSLADSYPDVDEYHGRKRERMGRGVKRHNVLANLRGVPSLDVTTLLAIMRLNKEICSTVEPGQAMDFIYGRRQAQDLFPDLGLTYCKTTFFSP